MRIEYYRDNEQHPYETVEFDRGCGIVHLRVVSTVKDYAPNGARFGDYGILVDTHNGVTHYPVELDVPRMRAV